MNKGQNGVIQEPMLKSKECGAIAVVMAGATAAAIAAKSFFGAVLVIGAANVVPVIAVGAAGVATGNFDVAVASLDIVQPAIWDAAIPAIAGGAAVTGAFASAAYIKHNQEKEMVQ